MLLHGLVWGSYMPSLSFVQVHGIRIMGLLIFRNPSVSFVADEEWWLGNEKEKTKGSQLSRVEPTDRYYLNVSQVAFRKSTHWHMAFPAHLISLSNAESICLCSKAKLTCNERFQRRVANPDCGVLNVKMHFNSRVPKYFSLLRSCKVCFGWEIRSSNPFSCGPMKISSVCGNSSIREVTSPYLLSSSGLKLIHFCSTFLNTVPLLYYVSRKNGDLNLKWKI